MSATIHFTKGHGTGNDFVLFSDPDGEVDLIAGVVQSSVVEFDAGSVGYKKDSTADSKMISSPYTRTVWGQQYEAMKKSIAVGLVMVT